MLWKARQLVIIHTYLLHKLLGCIEYWKSLVGETVGGLEI